MRVSAGVLTLDALDTLDVGVLNIIYDDWISAQRQRS